jgi:hypothetical protein
MANMAMVGYFFNKSKKEATIQQSTKIKLHRLLAIIFILRLVPRYCCWLLYWAKRSVAMVGRMRNDFIFVV